MKWRRTLYVLHRDVGFFCLGLVLVYVISGIAVNHREHWDFNYSIDKESTSIGGPTELLTLPDADTPGVVARKHQGDLVVRIGDVLGRTQLPRKVFWTNPKRLSLFYGAADSDVVDYLPHRGLVEHTEKSSRWLFREVNFLHMNEGRKLWTWLADGFAVLLAFLALSGVIMTRSRHGWRGRGGVLAAAGILLPVIAYLLLV